MVLLCFLGIALAGFSTDNKTHPLTSLQSIGLSAGNSYILQPDLASSTLDLSTFHSGLDYNWDHSNQRWDYSLDLHLYQTRLYQADRDPLYYSTHSYQHHLRFMVTNQIKVFAHHRFEEVQQEHHNSLHQRYHSGVGVGWSVVRNPKAQLELLIGGVLDRENSYDLRDHSPDRQMSRTLLNTPRNLVGTSGHWLSPHQNVAVNGYSFVYSSMLAPMDYLVETNVDLDVRIIRNLYVRTTLHHSYEQDPRDKIPSDTRITTGVTWKPHTLIGQ